MNKVAVVYLDRAGNDPTLARSFLRSIMRHPAGIDFQLVWQSKGYLDGHRSPEFDSVRSSLSGSFVEMRFPDTMYQFTMALEAARSIDCDRLLFLTSSSRVLGPNWLRLFHDAFDRETRCGMVGASGSFEATPDAPRFPNVHLRTNAFMIGRQRMLQSRFGRLQELADGNLVEAGPDSLTKQIFASGEKVLVLGRDGQIFNPRLWPQSQTFRSGQQENLLIADKRTHDYDISQPERRKMLARLAWGTDEGVSDVHDCDRLNSALDWIGVV